MNKQSIISCLFLISFLPRLCYSYETPQVYLYLDNNQKLSQKSSVGNILETCIIQAVPIAAPLVALGKFITSKIKNKKNNKTQRNVSNQPCIWIKKQELIYYPTIKITLSKKPKLSCKKISKQLLNQLCSVHGSYKKYRKLHTNQSKRLSQRIRILQQSLNENLKCSLYKGNWSDIEPTFIYTFNLDRSSSNLNGIKFQHVLQKEFHDIAQETALVWIHHRNNAHIQQLVEKNITCIKNGMEQNQSGKVIEATRLADIGWAILGHIQALGKGICQGTGNTIQVFLHPIDTIQGTARGIAQCTYYLGQATLEAIDLSTLAITDQNAARKKLQSWKQNFTQLVDTMGEQWQVTPSHDITQLVSRFTTEILLTGKAFHALGGLFFFVRINSTKLIGKAQKITKSIFQVTTPEGIITYVNKVVKHSQRTSKTGHTANRVTTRLRKPRKPIKERFEQRLQSRQTASTGNITKQSATELTKPKTVKKLAKKGKLLPPIKTYVGSLNNNNLKSNIIKKRFEVTQKMKDHIFSKNHKDNGILNLGKNEANIVDKFVNIVKLADHKDLLKTGPNQIHT